MPAMLVQIRGFGAVINRHDEALAKLARDVREPIFDRQVDLSGLALRKVNTLEFEIPGNPRVRKRADSPCERPGLIESNIHFAEGPATHGYAVHRERVQQFV